MKRSPKDTEDSARKISRRSLVVGGVMIGIGGVLAARMRYLQVEQADTFRLLAEENRINIRLLPPARGLIYDRAGQLVAGNEQNYRITMVREDADDLDAVLDRLARLINLDMQELERVRADMLSRPPFVPVTIADRLTWEDLSTVAVNAPSLPGVIPEFGLSRVYPMDKDFAHIVGYVGPVSDYYLETTGDTDPVLQIPSFQVGRSGVEARREADLRGSAGTKRIEVNAVGRVMRELDRVPATPGSDLQLTVDQGLQNYVAARLGNESASAVVIEVETGEIAAIASSPSFDPNLFVRGISMADWTTLNEDPYRPMSNKAVQGLYPPGSTFKIVTALAALEGDHVGLDETINCPGHMVLGNRRFHCWRRNGHGRMDLIAGFAQSCDVYYYELAQRVGIEAISSMARRLGLGVRHELPLSGVARGLAPTMAWKRENRDANWVVGDTLNSAIGQGFVLSSPMQLAIMTARVAAGRNVQPTLVKSVNGAEVRRPEVPELDINPDHLSIIREAMYSVNNTQSGTAYSSRSVVDEYQIAGKTGTSQVRNITMAERARGVVRNEDLPWDRRDHALFVGFAPYQTPKYAVSVVVEHGGGGSAVAAPVARDILLRALYGDVPPSSLYPSNQRQVIEDRHNAMDLRPTLPPAGPTGRSRA
jgi:penicillin-binding protein 2